jgi:hypothetical protein
VRRDLPTHLVRRDPCCVVAQGWSRAVLGRANRSPGVSPERQGQLSDDNFLIDLGARRTFYGDEPIRGSQAARGKSSPAPAPEGRATFPLARRS